LTKKLVNVKWCTGIWFRLQKFETL